MNWKMFPNFAALMAMLFFSVYHIKIGHPMLLLWDVPWIIINIYYVVLFYKRKLK